MATIKPCVPGRTHTSSSDGTSDFGQYFIAGNWLNTSGTNIIPAPHCLVGPSALDLVSLAQIETLDHFVREQGSRTRRKLHRFFGDLL
jgi:hypothetical protein